MADDLSFLARGLLLGFLIAAPVGPIGLLCIRRTLEGGRAVGLVSGLGAASADALYGGVAAFGLTAVADFLLRGQMWLRLLGGLFLCTLGLRAIRRIPPENAPAVDSGGFWGSYGSTFVLTLTNPLTMLSFAAAYAAIGVGRAIPLQAGLTVVGVFGGSSLWWFLLSTLVGHVRRKFDPAWMRWVNRISGLAIMAFGVLAILAAAIPPASE